MIKQKIFSLTPLLLPLILLCGYLANNAYWFISISVVFMIIISILDLIVVKDKECAFSFVQNMPENAGKFEFNGYWLIALAYLVLYLVVLAMGVYYAEYKQPIVGWFLYAIPLSLVSILALDLCHEFMHTKYKFERILSRIISSFCFWSVHEYEHLFIHHNAEMICTDKDTSYARLNQSFYSYLKQSVVSNFKNAWIIQKRISANQKQSFYNPINNPLLQSISLSIITTLAILVFVGTKGCLFFIIQALLAVLLFNAITYNQHYGLTRRKNDKGEYEPFTYMNIWSSNHYFTSRLSFNLSHHAHHHQFQFCRYQHLKIIEHSPQLPLGYPLMMALSFIPPLWYRVMNKRVAQVFVARDQQGF